LIETSPRNARQHHQAFFGAQGQSAQLQLRATSKDQKSYRVMHGASSILGPKPEGANNAFDGLNKIKELNKVT